MNDVKSTVAINVKNVRLKKVRFVDYNNKELTGLLLLAHGRVYELYSYNKSDIDMWIRKL